MESVSIGRERSLFSGIEDRELPSLRRDLSRLREQASTGKRINRPSDASSDFAVVDKLESLTERYERRERTIESAKGWAESTQRELDQLAELFGQAYENGVRAANESLSESDRQAIKSELKSVKDEVVDKLNATYRGEYIFAGNRTGEKPFDDSGAPQGGTAADPYSAIDGDRKRPAGLDQKIKTNVTGRELDVVEPKTGPSDPRETITGALDDLITAVDNNDTQAIQDAFAKTKEAQEHVLSQAAQAGQVASRLESAKEQVQSARLDVEERRSQVEDADLAKVATEIRTKQTQLQAALRAVASAQQTTLANFL